MKRRARGTLAAALSVLFFGAAPPADPLASVLSRLAECEKTVQSVRFDYTQTTEIKLTKEIQKIRGAASFQRPDKFRITLRGPQNQTIVSDGKTLWVFNESRNQVLTDKWENWSKNAGFPKGLTPFKMDTAELKSKYDITLENPKEYGAGKNPALKLTPKAATPWPYVFRVWVDMKTGLAAKTELSSSSVVSVTEVSKTETNPKFPADLFIFQPPAGADVLSLPGGKGQ